MPAVPITPRNKHRAATRRVPRTRDSQTETSAVPDAEPNMRLSRAILVMLLLHVVAVGGILAFSLIKERGPKRAAGPANNIVEAEDADASPVKAEGRSNDRSANDPAGALANARQTRVGEPLLHVTNEPTSANPPTTTANDAAERIAGARPNSASPSASNPPASDRNAHLPADSGKTYVVRAGDNPRNIADKFKIDPSALLKLNGIDDPRKLKPGRTLHIPAASRAKSR